MRYFNECRSNQHSYVVASINNFRRTAKLDTYHRYSVFILAKVMPQVVSGGWVPNDQTIDVGELFRRYELLARDHPWMVWRGK